MISVRDGQQQFPFSRGIMAKSLTGAGLPVSEAYEVVERVQDDLEQQGVEQIETDRLQKVVSRHLLQGSWTTEERFYRVRRRIKYLDEPLFILIGGATGVGKSSIAAELGHRLGIERVIGTDTIREIMRSIIPRNLVPPLHESSFEAGDALQSSLVKQQGLYAFQQQVQVVCEGVSAVLKRGVKEGLPMVINGVHLVPGFLNEEVVGHMPGHLFEFVLQVPDREQHSMFFYEREKGTRREAKRYTSRMDEIRRLQSFICEAADENNVATVANEEYEQTLQTLVERVISGLSEEINE
ncbi:MAG: ATP cone domain-containing protein [Planctomycetota bacterium]